MKIALAQINSTIGDLEGNAQKIIDYTRQAMEEGAACVVFPELALCGYLPMDLLNQSAFIDACDDIFKKLQHTLSTMRDIAVVVGHIAQSPSQSKQRSPSHVSRYTTLQNVASVLCNGECIHRQAKTLLPTYDVFDEARYFSSADRSAPFIYDGIPIGIAICEDLWSSAALKTTDASLHRQYQHDIPPTAHHDPVAALSEAEIVIVPAASPFDYHKQRLRHRLVHYIADTYQMTTIYVNAVGAHDSLIFDGNSFVMESTAHIPCRAKEFEEDLIWYEYTQGQAPAARAQDAKVTHQPSPPTQSISLTDPELSQIDGAIQTGIQEYLRKNNFQKVVLGLSGGIDSALVAALACGAIGSNNVIAIAMPSVYSSASSLKDARDLAHRLSFTLHEVSIRDLVRQYTDTLAPLFEKTAPDITEENLQARIRGTILMAYSNKFDALLLATGNKSELAVGYCTLYGDMCGGLAPIGDLFKTQVYMLAHYLNRTHSKDSTHPPLIPRSILEKEPSAELRPHQRDRDSLPPYELLDRVLEQYLLYNKTAADLVPILAPEFAALDITLAHNIIRMINRTEYKRFQAPPVLKLSPRSFGHGRRIPISRNLFP